MVFGEVHTVTLNESFEDFFHKADEKKPEHEIAKIGGGSLQRCRDAPEWLLEQCHHFASDGIVCKSAQSSAHAGMSLLIARVFRPAFDAGAADVFLFTLLRTGAFAHNQQKAKTRRQSSDD